MIPFQFNNSADLWLVANCVRFAAEQFAKDAAEFKNIDPHM